MTQRVDTVALREWLAAETHIISVYADGWTLRHPMWCRAQGDLFHCPATAAARRLREAPASFGIYAVRESAIAEGVIVLDGPAEDRGDPIAAVLPALLSAAEAVERVRDRHVLCDCDIKSPHCALCYERMPCSTLRALDGEG